MALITTEMNGEIYHIHPRFTFIGCNDSGDIINVISNKSVKGIKNGKIIEVLLGGWGYAWNKYNKHDIVYECHTGSLIPEGSYVKHIDLNKHNNAIINLELV